MNTIYNTIFINGEPFNCLRSISLHDLLLYLDFDVARIVVEYNQKILSGNQFDKVILNHQDKLEIITIVGGG